MEYSGLAVDFPPLPKTKTKNEDNLFSNQQQSAVLLTEKEEAENLANDEAMQHSTTQEDLEAVPLEQQIAELEAEELDEIKPKKPFAILSSFAAKMSTFIAFVGCLLSHFFFSLHPVFSRYLQTMPNPLPTVAIGGVANAIVLILFAPRNIYIIYKIIKKHVFEVKDTEGRSRVVLFIYLLRDAIFLNWYFWAFVISFAGRTYTNLLSSKYTLAIYVQLFSLSIPFLVTIMCTFIRLAHQLHIKMKKLDETPIFDDERMTFGAFIAVLVTVAGGALVIIGSSVPADANLTTWYSFVYNYKLSFTKFTSEFTINDVIGIGFTLVASCCLAFYMIVLRFLKTQSVKNATTKKEDPRLILLGGEDTLYLVQCVTFTCFIPASLLFESGWPNFLKMNIKDWSVFAAFTILVNVFANLTSMWSTRELGATVNSSLLPLRLASTSIVAAVLLNEWFKSIWQLVGCITVFTGVTCFVTIKYFNEKQRRKRITEAALKKEREEREKIELNEFDDESELAITRELQENAEEDNEDEQLHQVVNQKR